MPKIRPRTKYINGKYWHCRELLDQGKISIHAVSTKDQIADLLAKPLAENEFTKLKNRIMGKAADISAYLQGSVRKPEVMGTPEQKEGECKNIRKANNRAQGAICELEYHNDDGKNAISADEVKIKPKSRNKPGKVIEGMGKDLG